MLHMEASNVGAIRLYEKLGFVERAEITFWLVRPDRTVRPHG